MKKNLFLVVLLISCFLTSASFARVPATDTGTMKKVLPPVRKFYIGVGMDGAILSTASIQHTTQEPMPGGGFINSTTNKYGILRFSYFINYGITFNFNLARHFGVYTGIDIKNIGFIEHNSGAETVKRRTYNVGVPIGIKIGNMVDKGSYLFFGGGADVPVNYKEKTFVIRNQKTKWNEWFSSATPSVMPYVFVGYSLRNAISLKLQYYPGNFLNPNYTRNNMQEFTGYDVHLMLLSIGFPVPIGKHKDIVKKHVSDLNTATM